MIRIRTIFWLAVFAVGYAGMAQAESLQVNVGEQRLVNFEERVRRVAVGNPAIAGVNVVDTKQVMITGKKRGDTSLLVWPRGKDQPIRYDLVVASGDLPGALIPEKRSDLKTQVQTDIRIAEVSRTALRQLGINFLNTTGGDNLLRISPPGTSAGASGIGDFPAPDGGGSGELLSNTGFQPIGDAFNLLFADENSDFFGFISILERRGLMRTLASPSLVAMSGQTASFLAGGEFPIPVVQGGGGAGGGGDSITVEFKEFGIRLNLTPTVLQSDRIVLKVAPEVSELDFSAGITQQGIQIPGVRVRRTDTTVELGDGESFVISGLVDTDLAATVDKIPGLGDIPVLGTFFRSTQYDRTDRELIMVVTPHLVTPLKAGTTVPMPGDEYEDYNPGPAELFLFEDGDFRDSSADTGFTR